MSTTQIHQTQIDQQPTIWTVPDDLWQRIQPKLVINKPRKKTGCPRHPDRSIFNGIIHMARTGAQWSAFPKELAKKSTAFLDPDISTFLILTMHLTGRIANGLGSPLDPDSSTSRAWVAS